MPIGTISQQFSHLRMVNRDVVVTPCVPKQEVVNLHDHLEKNDPAYSSKVVPLKEHLTKLPKFTLRRTKTTLLTVLHCSKRLSQHLVIFSCGDLLFADDHHLSKVLVQKKNLTCESPIKKGYYNHPERKLELKKCCVQCGEMGPNDFLLCLPEFQA